MVNKRRSNETIYDLLAEAEQCSAEGYGATEEEWAHFGRRAAVAMRDAAREIEYLRDVAGSADDALEVVEGVHGEDE